jgi:hypothetical protein
MGQEVGGFLPGLGLGPARQRVHRQLPLRFLQGSGLLWVCNNAAAPVCKLQTPPKPAPACKREKRSRQGAKTNSNREGLGKMGRVGEARPGLAPHLWIPGVLTPPPGRPWLCNCKGGRKRESARRPGGLHPLPGPIVPGLQEAGPLGPSPLQEIPRAEWARGPAPFLN